jgi:hypothetical protein
MHRERLGTRLGDGYVLSKIKAGIVQGDAGSIEGTAWLLPLTRSLGSRAETDGARRTLRAASRTVEVTPEDQPRKTPLQLRQLVVRRREAQFVAWRHRFGNALADAGHPWAYHALAGYTNIRDRNEGLRSGWNSVYPWDCWASAWRLLYPYRLLAPSEVKIHPK